MIFLAVEWAPFLEYFWPEKPAARFVVEIELILAAAWLVILLWHVARICRAFAITQKLDAFTPELATEVITCPPDRLSFEEAERVFTAHISSTQISRRHPVAVHLQAILTSGYCDSALEVPELVRKTEEEVCRLDGFLRSTIGLFIILGLFGTLFSVADAILMLTSAQRPEIKDFLTELKGAFAPSLLGVAISILWVILQATVAYPLRSRFRVRLRERTVCVWITRLRPSTSQRITEAARHTLDAAGKVVAFAAEIEENSERWSRAVGSSSEAATTIAAAMGEMNAAVGSSRTVVETTLSELERKLQGFSTALGEWNSIRDRIAEFQAAVTQFQQHQAETENRIRDIAIYLASTTGEIHSGLKQSLNELQSATASLFVPVSAAADKLTDIGAGFTTTSAGLLDGLKTELASQISTLQSAHQQSLAAVQGFFNAMSEVLRAKDEIFVRQMQNLKEPFETAAGNLRDASSTAIIQWNTMIQDFNRRSDNLIAAIRETRLTIPPPPPAEPFLSDQKWEQLLAHIAELRAPAPQPAADRMSAVCAELARIRELLANVTLAPAAPRGRQPVPDYGVGEKVPTVTLPRGRRRDD
jgi:hypothetical protein